MIPSKKLAAFAQKMQGKKPVMPPAFGSKKVMPHHVEHDEFEDHDEHEAYEDDDLDPNEYSLESEEHQGTESLEFQKGEKEGALEFMIKESAEEVDDGGDDEIMELLNDYEEGDNPLWAKDHKTWNKAVKLIDPEGDGAEKFDNPYAVVAHLYKKMGGSIESSHNEE